MASVYTNDLRLEEIGSGEQSGTWGDTTNTNLELIAEAFSFGTEAITTNADTHATTIADGATDAGRSMFLKYTGTLDSACTITIGPNTVSKLWFIENGTSGSQNIIISQGSGANITIPAGQTKAIYSNGAGSGAAMVDAFATLNVVDLLVDDDLTVTDDVAIGGILGVTGVLTTTAATVFNGGFAANADSTMGTNKKLIFRDSAIHISSTADGDLSIAADDEIDITSTLIDINGAVDMSSTLAVAGVVTANAGVVVDEMTIDGDTLTATDTFTIDAVDDITLNSDNSGRILFGDDSVIYGIAYNSSSDFVLEVGTNDKDMLFKGQDNGSTITALKLDMAAAGTATFNSKIIASNGLGSTNGVTFFEGYYTAGNSLNTFGGMRSSGSTMIGRSVEPSGSTANGFVSSVGINAERSAIVLSGNKIIFSGAAASNVARGNAVTMTERMTIENDGNVTIEDGNLIVASGHGIDFAATSDGNGADTSELFNDYEEGTWTPTLPNGGSLTKNEARYTKVGRLVHAYCYIQITPTNNTSSFFVAGLPYPVKNINHYYGGGDGPSYSAGLNTTTWGSPLQHYGQSYVYWHDVNGGGNVILNNFFSGNSYPLIFNVTYFV